MVNRRWIVAVAMLAGFSLPGRFVVAEAPGSDGPIPTALGRGSFPWYDAESDKVRVVKLRVPPDLSPLDRLPKAPAWKWGDYLVFGCFVVTLIGVAILIARSWKRYEPTDDSSNDQRRGSRGNSAGEVLPEAFRRLGTGDDPWAEAHRLREAGDLAGAVVCLFVHQLRTLARLQLILLAPGRTGRQLHRSVTDQEFQLLMTPTLRQFEAVYYGHRAPSPTEFAALWETAEAFERRASTLVTR